MANNIRSSTTITANSRPSNGLLSTSGSPLIHKDNRDLLHPKVINSLIFFPITFHLLLSNRNQHFLQEHLVVV